MKERFLHFVWEKGLFDVQAIETTGGIPVEIVERGILNRDSGPDFSGARIRINGNLWAGNVEMHIRSSDWYRHGHQHDPAYHNTILHVVFENDGDVELLNGEILPCIELKHRIQDGMYSQFSSILDELSGISCGRHNPSQWKNEAAEMTFKALQERLMKKAGEILELHRKLAYDWQQLCFVYLSRYMGFRVNAAPMEQLAMSLPYQLILRNRGIPDAIPALLFGQSGLLHHSFKDLYPQQLAREYRFLAHKYGLKPMAPAAWKLMRMRPQNFPTLRLAQMASILESEPQLFTAMLNTADFKNITELFETEAHGYWQTHYRFDTATEAHSSKLGSSAAQGLAVNVALPLIYARGVALGQDALKRRVMDFLRQAPAESNRLTREWEQLGFDNTSAFDSQGLMALGKEYCNQKRCMECSIGLRIISK